MAQNLYLGDAMPSMYSGSQYQRSLVEAKKESVLHTCKSWIGLKNVQMAAYGHHFRACYRQVSWRFAFS
jgi:hypothetical protein